MIDLVKKNIPVLYIKYNVTNLVTMNFYPENNEYYFCSISIIRRLIDRHNVYCGYTLCVQGDKI